MLTDERLRLVKVGALTGLQSEIGAPKPPGEQVIVYVLRVLEPALVEARLPRRHGVVAPGAGGLLELSAVPVVHINRGDVDDVVQPRTLRGPKELALQHPEVRLGNHCCSEGCNRS